jgi:hypothetical protein
MMWRVTLAFAAMSLLSLCALPSCIPVVGADDPLIITVTRDGSDEPACLEGKIACNTFTYACQVYANGSDVTIVITYPQEYYGDYADGYVEIDLGRNTSNTKLIGQVEDGYTFICTDNLILLIESSSEYSMSSDPRQLWLENVQVHGCAGGLTVSGIDSVYLTGFIGQGFTIFGNIKTVNIEDSTFIYSHVRNPDKSIIENLSRTLTSFTVKNSSLIHKEQNGSLLETYLATIFKGQEFSILFENTNFTLTQPLPPDPQPAPMQLLLTDNNLATEISVNFTISKCNFFNYNSTALEFDVYDKYSESYVDMYLNVLDSKFHVPQKSIMISRVNSVTVFQPLGVQANVHTRIDGNTFIPSD